MLIVLSLITQLPLALFCAILVGRHLRGRAFFRMIYFLPFVLSEVVTGLIWSFIYHPRAGLLNWVLKRGSRLGSTLVAGHTQLVGAMCVSLSSSLGNILAIT